MHPTVTFAIVALGASLQLAACGGPPTSPHDGATTGPGASATTTGTTLPPPAAEPPPNAPRSHAPPPTSATLDEIGPGEGRTAEQLGRAIMAAFDDLTIVPSLYPTDALLRRALDCEDEEIYRGIAAMRAKAPSEMGARPAGSKLVYLRTAEESGYGDPELHPPGAVISGCTTTMEVELRVHGVDYTMITLDGSELRKLVMLFVRFGDYGWYVFE